MLGASPCYSTSGTQIALVGHVILEADEVGDAVVVLGKRAEYPFERVHAEPLHAAERAADDRRAPRDDLAVERHRLGHVLGIGMKVGKPMAADLAADRGDEFGAGDAIAHAIGVLVPLADM